MKQILGGLVLLLSFGALAQDDGTESEHQILVDKVHTEPIKLEDKEEKKKPRAKKKTKKVEKSEVTDQ